MRKQNSMDNGLIFPYVLHERCGDGVMKALRTDGIVR
jgi:hypothetical protein